MAGLGVLLAAMADLGDLRASGNESPVVTMPDGREVVLLLTEADWDDVTDGVVHTAASAVEEARRLVAESTTARAYLVAGQYTMWLSPYDPGRR